MSHQPSDGEAPPLGIIPAEVMKCSICLEDIVDDNQKGISKLQCGHFFHLACIGVAFNARGAMVCPNCRKVEDSEWRYFQENSQHNEPPLDGEEFTDDDDEEEEDISDDGETYQENNTDHHMHLNSVPSYSNDIHQSILGSYHDFTRLQFMQPERRMFEMPTFGYEGDGRNNWFASNHNNSGYYSRLLLQNMYGFGLDTGSPGVGTSLLLQGGISNPLDLNIPAPPDNLPSSSTPPNRAQGLHSIWDLNASDVPELLVNHGSRCPYSVPSSSTPPNIAQGLHSIWDLNASDVPELLINHGSRCPYSLPSSSTPPNIAQGLHSIWDLNASDAPELLVNRACRCPCGLPSLSIAPNIGQGMHSVWDLNASDAPELLVNHDTRCPYSLPSSSTPPNIAQGLHSVWDQNESYEPEIQINYGSSSSTASDETPQLGLNVSIGGGRLYGN